MKKIIIPTKLNPIAKELLEDNGNYSVVHEVDSDLPTLAKENPDAYGLIVRSNKVTPEVIDALPSLKVIVRAGSGYNTIDTKYARSKGIDVMNTPGANANAVAEEVVALMLADARHILRGDKSVREELWEKKQLMGTELTNKTIGILGCGAIGRLVAKRLSGFDVRVLAFDPVLSADRADELGMELVEMKELFAKSDYITLHIPENDATRGIVNKDLISEMKTGATLVNCARAGIIDEDDLRDLKKEKGIRFLNDVYPSDAAGPKSVADIANIMMPHLGASTLEANYNAARRAAQQLIDLDEKGIGSYIVNRDVPKGLDSEYGELANALARVARQLVGREGKLKMLETSVYGKLKPFSKWMLVPILSALSDEFDRSMDAEAAREYLKENGVDYADRETDEGKGYGNSITLDLAASVDSDSLQRVSVRGTVTEGNLMISRIGDFNKLYFEPVDNTAIFIYKDRPGVLGKIAAALADVDINIDDVRNPHNSKGTKSLAILKLNRQPDQAILEKIGKQIDAETAVCVAF